MKNYDNFWDRFERDVADIFGGSVVKGSGRSDQHKGDVICDSFLIECKATQKPSYIVPESLLHKIATESISRSKDWLFCVRCSAGDFCIIPIVALPANFDLMKCEQMEIGKSIIFSDKFFEGIYLFASGRRVYACEMSKAKAVINGENKAIV